MQLQIESDVPVPEDATIPFDAMEIGQSVLFPIERRKSVQTMASRQKQQGRKFRIKKINDTQARVWRVE